MSLIDQFQSLQAFLEKLTKIPLTDIAQLIRHVEIVKVKKGELLFAQGSPYRKLGLVKSGLLYTYFLEEDGKKIVKNFAWEGRLIAPYASIILEQPAWFTSEALEDTTVFVIDYDKYIEIQKSNKTWLEVRLKSVQLTLIEREKREYEFLTKSLLQRYDEFNNYYHPIKDRVTQEIIASFIGVTPVSLSRALAARKLEK